MSKTPALLVANDEEANRVLLEIAFSAEKYRVVYARDGLEAICRFALMGRLTGFEPWALL